MMPLSEIAEIIALVRDLTLLASAVVGACVAVLGLNAWRDEMKGRAVFDLSRRMLVETYRFRDHLQYIRAPFMQSAEMESPPQGSIFSETKEGRDFYAQWSGYRRRIEPADEARQKLLVDLAEAEALWGSEIRTEYNKLFSTANELIVEIDMYLNEINPENPSIRPKPNDDRERMYLLYRTSSSNDEFSRRLDDSIRRIETLLKPHLRR